MTIYDPQAKRLLTESEEVALMKAEATLVDSIRAGDRVTIVNRFGQKSTGRAVMRGPYGWVLNMGGKHGTPGIASAENTVRVRSGR